MSIDKYLSSSILPENKRVPRFDNIGISHDIHSSLNSTRYPELREYLQFIEDLKDFEDIITDENLESLYYYFKTLLKLIVPTLKEVEKGNKKNLLEFLTEAFFVAWDSKISELPTSVNNLAGELYDYIDREKLGTNYPLAAKTNYHLLNNKTFLEGIKNKFLSNYSSKNPKFCENIINQIKDIDDPKSLMMSFVDLLNTINTGENIVDIYFNDLIKGICDRFYIDHKKKEQKNIVNTTSCKNFDNVDDILCTEDVKNLAKIKLLNMTQLHVIDEFVANFSNLGEKLQKEIKKYLVRILVNKEPFKVEVFIKNYGLESFPDDLVLLLDDLGIDVCFNQKDEKLENVDFELQQEDEKIENTKSNEVENFNKRLMSLCLDNPLEAIIQKAKLCGYQIENENLLKKQIDGACKSSKYVKDSLLISIFKDSFSRPILKHSGAYSLNAGGCGYRFVLRQDNLGKFTIVGFYKHDDYEKILDGKLG